MKKFRTGYATTPGYTHRKLDYNNQDAVLLVEHENYTIGIIADGCGSGANSEVGAQLAVKYLAKLISEKNRSKGRLEIRSERRATSILPSVGHSP